ncbi:hypothetical protein CRENBAI_018283 [Crenichthys baileyi]|uniref:Uncharacterized protein n=1 Tax=Crenichthys baileyi TaxID=28760 RepID=A0AAV9RXU2_9TELE
MDRSFEVEDFASPTSLEVKGGFVEPSEPEPYHFEMLAQGAESKMPEAGAAEAVEAGRGPVLSGSRIQVSKKSLSDSSWQPKLLDSKDSSKRTLLTLQQAPLKKTSPPSSKNPHQVLSLTVLSSCMEKVLPCAHPKTSTSAVITHLSSCSKTTFGLRIIPSLADH